MHLLRGRVSGGKVLGAGIGLLAVLVAAWFLSARARQEPPPPGEDGFLYFYCPNCGFEMTCTMPETKRRVRCLHCGKSEFEVFNYSHARRGVFHAPAVSPAAGLALAVPVVLAGMLFLLRRKIGASGTEGGGKTRTVTCPGCHHRRRYPATQAGERITCPVCGERIELPGARDDSISARRRELEEWRGRVEQNRFREDRVGMDRPRPPRERTP